MRARISVIAELPAEWAAAVRRWNRAAPLGDGPLAHLVWQAAVGAWPIDRDAPARVRRRRPPGRPAYSTGWIDPDERVRGAPARHGGRHLRRPGAARVAGRHGRPAGRSRPGELVERQADPAHHARGAGRLPGVGALGPVAGRSRTTGGPSTMPLRRDLLARLDRGWRPEFDPTAPADDGDPGATKLLVTSMPRCACAGTGPSCSARTGHSRPTGLPPTTRSRSIAAARSRSRPGCPSALAAAGGWRDTALPLPRGAWTDELTGRAVGGRVSPRSPSCSRRYPVALLVADGADGMSDQGVPGAGRPRAESVALVVGGVDRRRADHPMTRAGRPLVRGHRRDRPARRADRLRLPPGRRRQGAARPAVALATRRGARTLAAPSSRRTRVAGRGVDRPPAGWQRHLRDAHRHLHPGGHARRRHRASSITWSRSASTRSRSCR